MPYKLKMMGKGAKVVSPNHPKGFSHKPMTLRAARAQLYLIMKNTKGEK